MKKRGFTLIELLAVIVVLAIIALIATPIVMNLIKNAKLGAAERSAERYLDAVELAVAQYRVSENEPLADGEYTVDANGNLVKGTKTLTVEVSGEKPAEGSKITIVNGVVAREGTTLDYVDYEVTLDDKGEAKAVVKVEKVLTCLPLGSDELQYKYSNHPAESDYATNPILTGTYTTGTKSVGDAYRCTVGKDLSYIFNILSVNEDDNTVTLLMNENLVNNVKWCANGSNNSCNADGAYAALTANTTAWTNDKISVDLPSLSQIAVADGQPADSTWFIATNSWLVANMNDLDKYAYWTTAKEGNDAATTILFTKLTNPQSVDVGSGIRPVITIPAGEI